MLLCSFPPSQGKKRKNGNESIFIVPCGGNHFAGTKEI